MTTYKVRMQILHLYEFEVEVESNEDIEDAAIRQVEMEIETDVFLHDFEVVYTVNNQGEKSEWPEL